MTIHLGKYFGIYLRQFPDVAGRRWLCAVIWYPRSRNELGYLYPSIRIR
jgi:hypothetical protein